MKYKDGMPFCPECDAPLKHFDGLFFNCVGCGGVFDVTKGHEEESVMSEETTDHDRLCPECRKPMLHEGGGTYVCKPCDISMDAVDFEDREAGVTSKPCPECDKPLRFAAEYSEEVHYQCTGCRSYIVVNTSGGKPTEKVSREEYDEHTSMLRAKVAVLKELIAEMVGDALDDRR